MNQYKLTPEEVNLLLNAFEVVKKGLPYSTTVIALDATNSLTIITDISNKLRQQHAEFNTPDSTPVPQTDPNEKVVHQLDNGGTPARRPVVRRQARRTNS